MLTVLIISPLYKYANNIPLSPGGSLNSDIMLCGLLWLIPFIIYTVIRLLSPAGRPLNATYFPFFKRTSVCFGIMYTIFFLCVFFLFRAMNIYHKYDLEHDFNIIPFKTLSLMLSINDPAYVFKNLIGNIFFFFPPGFYMAVLLKKAKWYHALLCILLLSSSIEALQYIFDTGTADVDDVLLNVIGFLFGFLFKYILDGIRSLRTGGKEKTIFKNL